MRLRNLIVAALTALAMTQVGFSDDAKPKPVEVPFELLRSRHMAIQVMINGKGPYRFVFDTGAPINIISKKVGEEAGLTKGKTGRNKNNMMLGGGQVAIESLDAGDLKAKDLAAIVIDHPTVVAMAKVLGPIEGIVGFPLFAQYATTIDYQASKLTFTPNGYKPKDLVQQLTASLLTRSSGQGKDKVVGSMALWGLTTSKADSDQEAGVVINEVFAGSAAAVAGLKSGDRLLSIDGRWTEKNGDLLDILKDIPAGRPVEWEVMRSEKRLAVRVTPRAGL